MGSDSDLPVVQKAASVLKELGISFEAHVYSAHRTPAEARAWSLAARDEGFGVIIAFAGMAAHLAGAIAANAALLAAEILALADDDLANALAIRRDAESEAVLEKDDHIMERI